MNAPRDTRGRAIRFRGNLTARENLSNLLNPCRFRNRLTSLCAAGLNDVMIEVEKRNAALVLRVVEPQLQMYNIPQFKTAVTSILADKPALVVFDLGPVDHVDSSAMGALFHFQRGIKEYGGSMAVANVCTKVMQIFKVTKSEHAFPLFDSVDEAITGKK